MTEINIANVTPVTGKAIVAPIKNPFNYLCSFRSNIKKLMDEAKILKNVTDDLRMQVDAAYRDGEGIPPEVEALLDDCMNSEGKTIGIQFEISNVSSGCLAIKSRYSLSKKAKKTADALKDLQKRCMLTEVLVPAPPAAKAPIPQGPSDEFESRKRIEEKIMGDLKSRNVHIMGICGMGGVGKTFMAERIMNKVREENLFDEVMMVVVSQPVDMLKIQGEIADLMGLELKEVSLLPRANKLHDRLMSANRFLLILDDLWEDLELKKLGIPCESDLRDGCAIVLTSRNTDVLRKMDAKSYAIQILSEEEAWFLFREKVGTWLDNSDLISITKEVAKECKGLPLALKMVGTVLKNEKRENFWKDALDQLKDGDSREISYFLNEIYRPFKLSYDSLENQHMRSLFLLCCIFPEDSDINLDDLTMCGIGLHMFEGMSMERARRRVRILLEMLKGHFLLLDGRDENHVKMHDVVRDAATFIASEEGRVDRYLRNCTWISVIGEQINKLHIDTTKKL